MSRADMLVAVGLELEVGWLPTLQTGARNPAITKGGAGYLECGIYAPLKDVPSQKVDRSMGDIHPSGNPHYLYAPDSARGCASAIAARLAALDPDHAKDYQAGYRAFDKELTRRLAGWSKQLAPYKGTGVITYHRSWIYLLDWAGLHEVDTLEPKPRAAKAHIILEETFYPNKTAKLVASKIGGQVVEVASGPDFAAGQSYFDYVDGVVSKLTAALGK
jgi:zinc/manganese transport system substrate-binding protein